MFFRVNSPRYRVAERKKETVERIEKISFAKCRDKFVERYSEYRDTDRFKVEERSMSHDFRLFFSGDIYIYTYMYIRKDDRVIDSGRVVVDGDTYEARILKSRGQHKRGRDSRRNKG